MNSINIVYLLASYFGFIMLFGGPRYKIHSLIIFSFSIINLLMDDVIPFEITSVEYLNAKITETNIAILMSGAPALLLTFSYFFDKLAGKQAILLVFATMCYMAVIFNQTVQSVFITDLIFRWHVELIILIGIMQMWVSRDGLIESFERVLWLVRRFTFYYRSCTKFLFERKKTEDGS